MHPSREAIIAVGYFGKIGRLGWLVELCGFLSRCVGFGCLRAAEKALNPRPVTQTKSPLESGLFVFGFVGRIWTCGLHVMVSFANDELPIASEDEVFAPAIMDFGG